MGLFFKNESLFIFFSRWFPKKKMGKLQSFLINCLFVSLVITFSIYKGSRNSIEKLSVLIEKYDTKDEKYVDSFVRDNRAKLDPYADQYVAAHIYRYNHLLSTFPYSVVGRMMDRKPIKSGAYLDISKTFLVP